MRKKKIGILFLCIIIGLGLIACGKERNNSLDIIEVIEIEEVEKEDEIIIDSSNELESEKEPINDELTGEFKEFTAEDIYGNIVTEDIIKGNRLTVINIWATFCGPCLNEMPDLGELAEEYADQDVGFIGICLDIYDESNQETAKNIVEDTGATYTHLMVSDDLANIYISKVQAVPETLFLDSTGTIIGSTIGSNSKIKWQKIIDGYLE